MDWVKLLTELTASLTEWVLGNAVPEPVPSAGRTEANLAADDSDFADVVCDETVYVVSHLSREAEECGLLQLIDRMFDLRFFWSRHGACAVRTLQPGGEGYGLFGRSNDIQVLKMEVFGALSELKIALVRRWWNLVEVSRLSVGCWVVLKVAVRSERGF